jgi:hypothetical protein
MTDVLQQAEPLGASDDELLVFSRCRADAEADAPVAVLVDDEPREVLLADKEASGGGRRSSAVASGRARQMFVARSSNSASTATSLTKRRLAAPHTAGSWTQMP